jgi:small subunit ribosomal protein S6
MMFVISPLHTTDDDLQAVIDRVQQTIEAGNGEVRSVNYNSPWGRRRLAYPIRAYAGGEASRRSFQDGFYVLMHFSMMASQVIELERTLKLSDAILRHLITLLDEPKSTPLPDLDEFEGEDAAETAAETDEERNEHADEDETDEAP